MNTAVTLTAAEFRQIHNALCLASNRSIEETVDIIREALQGAYAQDDAAFDRKHSHYRTVQEKHGLKSTWSLYEVEDMDSPHPYPGSSFVIYNNHWGHKPMHAAVWGPNWTDIYKAADACIQESGDGHHVFIEAFELKNGNELHLITGS